MSRKTFFFFLDTELEILIVQTIVFKHSRLMHGKKASLRASQWDILALTFSLYGSMVSGSGRTRPVMWNTAGVSMMGGGHTASWVFCRGEPEPMPRADRTNQGTAQPASMHTNQPVTGAGSRASAGVHCHGYSSIHTILPEQVNQVKGMRCLGMGCTRLRGDLQLHHCFSHPSKEEVFDIFFCIF